MTEPFVMMPPSSALLNEQLAFLKRDGADFRLFTAGKSYLGTPITAAAMGSMQQPILFVGGLYGDDWMTTALLLRFLQEIATPDASPQIADCRLPHFFRNGGIVVVPLMNPDGLDITQNGSAAARHLKKQVEKRFPPDGKWHANAVGIDINRNFDADFVPCTVEERAISGSGGMRPHSEPETRALLRLCSIYHFRRVVVFQNDGEQILAQFGAKAPISSRTTAELLCNACGYELLTDQRANQSGSFKDWFVQTSGAEGYAIKIGRSTDSLTYQDLAPIYARLLQTLLLFMVL